VNFRVDVGEHPFQPDRIGCEVQIRTQLQHAWAELTHDDIYKQVDRIPDDLTARATDLAAILDAADKIASDIRSRVGKITHPPEKYPDLEQVSSAGMASVYSNVFGRAPSDYLVTQGLGLCKRLKITSIARLPEVLGPVRKLSNRLLRE
jgi:hypothetical protein